MDLYTSINSCRNLRTTVKWVFHEKKKNKNKKPPNESGKIILSVIFCSILRVEIQSYSTQKDQNLIKKIPDICGLFYGGRVKYFKSIIDTPSF